MLKLEEKIIPYSLSINFNQLKSLIIQCGIEEKVEILVTGDEDLLALNPFHGVEVTNYRSFQDISQKLDLKVS